MRVSLVIATIGAVFGGPVGSANGEPVTFSYTVRIDTCDVVNASGGKAPPLSCGAYPSSFPLSVTFNPDVSTTEVEPHIRAHRFGEPEFSDVPLVLPALPSVTERVTITQFNEYNYGVDILGVNQDALVIDSASFRRTTQGGRTMVYSRGIYLFGVGKVEAFTDRPLETMLGLVQQQFRFGYSELEEGPDGTHTDIRYLTYTGIAELEPNSPSPVPEPSSMLLLSSGAAALAVMSWRRRRPGIRLQCEQSSRPDLRDAT